jgi:carbohydrate-binding DOMON domain-containing protein
MALATHHSVLALTLWIVGGAVALAVLAGLLSRWLIRLGLREPFVVRLINHASDRVVDTVKKPITIAVLDEVASVLQTGHYTRNIASALEENRDELKQMVAEKIRDDPMAGRIYLVPFHDRLIEQVTDTTFRVILEILADPRTDELVSDMLRDNISQIRQAVRADGA